MFEKVLLILPIFDLPFLREVRGLESLWILLKQPLMPRVITANYKLRIALSCLTLERKSCANHTYLCCAISAIRFWIEQHKSTRCDADIISDTNTIIAF